MRSALAIGLLVACALGGGPGVAHAEWLQASSAHFVVYADDSERDIQQFSQQLERYHAALAMITSVRLPSPSPSNRVTVYVVGGEREVRRLHGGDNRYLGAFYLPRAGGSLAIVPRVATGTTDLQFSMIALLHEYAHHYMLSASTFPMPRWYSEGGAEFFASANFPSDGGVGIGRAAVHRGAELLMPGFARDVTVAELLDPPAIKGKRPGGYDAFYGKSWLLFHYLSFDEARQGQLSRYLELMIGGKSSREAGIAAFGDFAVLERDVDAYLRKSRIMTLKLPATALTVAPIAVRRLTPGEAAMMPVRIRSKRGVTEDEAKTLLVEARAVAARFPGDAAVLAALAEAEYDAGNDAEALAAANAALVKDPAIVDGHVEKGLALFRMAESADDQPAAYLRARRAFAALNQLETDHPLPLIYYFRSFVDQGQRPSDLAFDGLARAVELAPFDLGLRMTLAMAEIGRKRFVMARALLGPIAYDPHGSGLAGAAQRVLAKLDADPKWDGHDAEAIANAASDQAGE
jgi:tetratricopeptide (TPR) repeat protein